MNRCSFFLLAIGSLAADWPGWRGPTGQGQTDDTQLPLVWGGNENTNVLWKVPLPGVEAGAGQDQNQSSPVIFRDRIFVTASHWPGKPDGTKQPEHRVACYRLEDGKELWNVPVPAGPWRFGDLRGGYTAPTPAVDADRVYVAFGSSVLAALDHSGTIRWRKEIVPYKFDVAFAASPVLYEQTVILQCDQLDRESRILAFDRTTGESKWEQKRPKVGFAHSTPTLATVAGKPQLLVSASNALQGLDPRTGEVLWSCEAKGDTVSPVFAGGVVYCDSGRGGPGLAVDPTGTGDVAKTHRKWTIKTVKEGYGSPVASGEFLYRLSNPDVLTCIRLSTGEVVYTERLPGISASASPVAAPNGRVYFASAGKSYIVKAGEKFEILAMNDLGDGGPASPAVASGKLILKGREWLHGVGIKP
jgi:outer membrane protein assembly factor BamB